MRMIWKTIQLLGPFFWMPMILSLIGLMCLYSSASTSGPVMQSVFAKQVLWWLLGWGLYWLFLRVPIQFLIQSSYLLYGFTLLLLIAVIPFGSGPAGRWLDLGVFRIQPSEIAKLVTILAIARCLSADQEGRISGIRYLFVLMLALLPAGLVLIQPDAATGGVFVVIGMAALFWAGVSVRVWLVIGVLLLAGMAGISWIASGIFLGLFSAYVLWRRRTGFMLGLGLVSFLVNRLVPKLLVLFKPYQIDRIRIFFGLKTDPFGGAYQMIQSKIAIGSGGFFGKGFLQGSQTQLRFLPEQHTDFIFSVLAEEFGFFAIFVVLSLFFWYQFRIFQVAETVPSRWAGYVLFSAGALFLFQVAVNTGMTIGLFPVMGLPLPFFSYGGSALCLTLSLSGVIGNCFLSRRSYSF